MAAPIQMSYVLETRASIARTWRTISDTDRFNVAAEAGFTFSHEVGPDGRPRAMAQVKKLGLTIRWQEEPFSFRAPTWFRIHRVFEGGPAKSLTAFAQLAARPDGGTTVKYDLVVQPRTSIFKPLLQIDLRRSTEPKLRAALNALVSALDKSITDEPDRPWAAPPPQLGAAAADRLASLASCLVPSRARDRLVSFIRAAPERDQSQISPLVLAQAWGEPLDEVVGLLVDATRVGMLGVRVDLLCPACLVPRREFAPDGVMPAVHCEGCGIRLDATFPESLAVHFFPAPDVRALSVKVECLGSPAQSPHIAAQETLDPGQTTDLAVALEPGMHQIRTIPALGPPALVQVGDGEQGREASFNLTSTVQPQLVNLRPEPKQILFRNGTNERVTVILERLAPPRRVLTLGRMLAEYPGLSQVIPNAGYFANLSCFRATALSLRGATETTTATIAGKLSSARVVYVSSGTLLAIYPTAVAALQDLTVVGLSEAMTGITTGIVFEHVLGGRVVPMGPAIDRAYAIMFAAVPGQVALSASVAREAEVDLAVRNLGFMVQHGRSTDDGEPIAWVGRPRTEPMLLPPI